MSETEAKWVERLREWQDSGNREALGLAGWSIIDDHETVMYLGPEGRAAPSNFYELLMAGEGGRPGGSARFRPGYYFARLTEAMIWGNHPGVWFRARLAFFATFLGAVVWVLRRQLSVLENAFLAVLIAAFPLWGTSSRGWGRVRPTACSIARCSRVASTSGSPRRSIARGLSVQRAEQPQLL